MPSLTSVVRSLLRVCGFLFSFALAINAWANPPEQVLDSTHAKVKSVMAVQRDVTRDLMRQPEILGTAVGLDDQGEPALVVYVNRKSAAAAETIHQFSPRIKGVALRAELTDMFVALKGRPTGSTSHTARQTPPIQLGTSGGWRQDLANGYCCGGTLGSLIRINGEQYILSNYHVFESDIVPGGNGTVAQSGDSIIQPGLVDVNGSAANAQNVATLVKSSSLPGSNVDAAIAKVVPGMVNTNGSILEIGTLSSQTIAAYLNQAVKKSGRTTRLTRSQISGLNASVSVAYDNECAGGAAFTKTFSGQIIVSNSGSGFLNSGDSGSLMVEDVSTNPRAVGLLFAGSSSLAVANPIAEVLAFFGATMVGN